MARSLGRKTGALLKFRKPGTPRAARDFKRMYPAEFELLKAHTGGRDFSDEVLASLREAYTGATEWVLVEDEFRIESAIEGLRRYLQYYPQAPNREWVRERMNALIAKGPLCPTPNKVLKLCVAYEDITESAREARLLDALSQSAEASGHPAGRRPLYCVGWIRWCDTVDGVWLVEEVQSDVSGARRGLDDPFMQAQLRGGGIDPREVAAVLDRVAPWHDHLYEDAIGFLLERAAAAGVRVEMVDHSYKQDEEAPRSVYTDLPRSMGMKLSPGSEVSEKVGKTWKTTPNRRSSKRRSSKRR